MNKRKIEIQNLYIQIKKDNELAFSNLYNLLWEPLFRRAYAILKDTAIAQDIVQEIFIDFWNKRKTSDINDIEAYLMRATRFSVYKYIRDNKKVTLEQEAILLALPSDAEIENKYNLEELEIGLEKILKQLTPRVAEIFRLSKLEGLDNQKIAEKLEISIRSVDNQISKALKYFKQNLMKVVASLLLLAVCFIKL